VRQQIQRQGRNDSSHQEAAFAEYNVSVQYLPKQIVAHTISAATTRKSFSSKYSRVQVRMVWQRIWREKQTSLSHTNSYKRASVFL
jgi:hypothetical protein